MEVVKELGLITCERGEFGQGARLLIWRRRRVCLPWRRPHGGRGSGQGSGRSGKRRARDRRDTEKNKARNRERTNAQSTAHMNDDEYEVMRTDTFLSRDVSVHHSVCTMQERNDV